MRILLFILIQLIYSNGMAQKKFHRVIGDVNSNDVSMVLPSDDCGYLIIGYHNINGTKGLGVVKTDAFGETESSKLHVTHADIWPSKSVKLTDGYLILSRIKHFVGTDYDILITKIGFSGNLIWSRKYKGAKDESARDIVQTGIDEFVVLGTTNSLEHIDGQYFMLLFKINASGDLIWSNIYRNFAGTGRKIVEFSNNDLMIVGLTSSPNGKAVNIKTTSEGKPKWAKYYTLQPTNEFSYELILNSISLTGKDSLVILGDLRSSFFIFKTDSSGNIYSSRLYQSGMGGYYLFLTAKNHMVVTGPIDFVSSDADPAITMLSPQGDPVWARRFKLTGSYSALHVTPLFDGSFISGISGWDYIGSSLSDLNLIKMDEDGSSDCSQQDFTITVKDSMPNTGILGLPLANSFSLQVEDVSFNTIDLTLQNAILCMDDTPTACGPTSIINNKGDNFKKVEVYPNPIVKQFILKAKSQSIKNISIYNSEGKSVPFVLTSIDSETVEVVLKVTDPGLYFVKGGFESGGYFVEKISIEAY